MVAREKRIIAPCLKFQMADDAHIERSTYFFNAIGKGDFEVVKAMLE